MLRDPSFIVIPVGGDEVVSRDEVVAGVRARLAVDSIEPRVYVIDHPWMVLSIANHIQPAGVGSDDATAGTPDHNRRRIG